MTPRAWLSIHIPSGANPTTSLPTIWSSSSKYGVAIASSAMEVPATVTSVTSACPR